MRKIISCLLLLVAICFLASCDEQQTENPVVTPEVTEPATQPQPTQPEATQPSGPTQPETLRVVNGIVLAGGNPVEGATVKIRNKNYETKTDADGKFSFTIQESKTELKEFRIIVTKEGYEQNTADVLEGSFVDGVANVTITLLSSTVELKGAVKNTSGETLEGVKVSINGTDSSTTTDSKGNYSLTIERPVGIELVFELARYEVKTLVIDDFSTGDVFENDVVLEDLLVSISGVVFNNYEGVIANATVAIVGTEYTTTTNEKGEYSLANAELETEDYEISVSKDGYLTSVYTAEDAENLELISDYTRLPDVGEVNLFEAYVTKASHGMYFKFIVDEFKYGGGEQKVQLFINPGPYTEDNRMNGSHTAEIALTSNNGICVVVNYIQGTSYVSSIDWLKELIYTTEVLEDGRTQLNLYLMYSVFADYFGEEFAIDSNSVIGLNITSWSDFTPEKPAEGWLLNDMPGVDGKPLVYHDNPQDWPRLSGDGKLLYEGSSNKSYDIIARTVSGVVSSEGTNLEGALVQIPSLGISTTTNENGEYTLTIPLEKFAVEQFTVKVTALGYVDSNLVVSEFISGAATLDVELVKGTPSVTVSGSVVDKDGNPIDGVTVTIKGTDISTTTNADGFFEFIEAEHEVAPYILTISKDGYYGKSVTVNNLIDTLESEVVLDSCKPTAQTQLDLPIASEYSKVGSALDGNLEVYVAYQNGRLLFKYVLAEGAAVNEYWQGIYFGGEKTYEVRFKKGWVGIYLRNDGSWPTWNSLVENPIYGEADADGKVTITQAFNLSYFTALGEDVSNIYLTFDLRTPSGSRMIEVGENTISISDTSKWLKVVAAEGTTTVTGKVTKADGSPLSSATVSIKDTNISTITNTNGIYKIFAAPNATAPYTLVITAAGYETKEVEVATLTATVSDVALAEEAVENNATLTSEPLYLGTVGASNLKAYVSLEGTLLKLKYETAEGTAVGEVNQYFTFGNGVIYEVRFNTANWTGIFNVNKNAWEAWNDKVGNAKCSNAEGKLVITQTIDLTYFTALGVDISAAKLIISEQGSNYIKFNDGASLPFDNTDMWINLLGIVAPEPEDPEQGGDTPEPTPDPTPEPEVPVVEEVYLGTIGASNVEAYATLDGNTLTMRYEVTEGTTPGQINQFFIFDNDVVYEVRFDQNGWTGVWNWEAVAWETWAPKVAVPTYKTENGLYIMTQVIDLTYFSDLGLDITGIKFNAGEDLAGETHLMHNGNRVNFNDHSTWVDLVGLFEEKEEPTPEPEVPVVEEVFVGVAGDSNLNVYATLDGTTLTMRYEALEGTTVGEINQFFIFDNDVVYEVRFNQASWTGVWNWGTSGWETWTNKIANPTYKTENGLYIMTQIIDLTYFSDLGLGITGIKFNAGENLKGETHLMYNDVRVNFNDHSTWVDLVGLFEEKEEPTPEPEEPVVEEEYLGSFGASNVKAYALLDGNTLTMRYEVAEGTTPGQINQFFIFDNDVVYEVRFDQNGWTGVWNWEAVAWETWAPKVAVPTYKTENGLYIMTQVIDLTYFSDLGLDITGIKFDAGEDLAGETHLVYKDETPVSFTDHSTWVVLR